MKPERTNRQERFSTQVHYFDERWVDSDGLLTGAWEWAEKNLAPGQRVIGHRALSFNGELDIYKFDFRHSRDYGINLECEIPARCRTVIRANRRQMIIVETESGTLVSKHLRFIDANGDLVWRPWMRRVYDYHIEDQFPGQNLMIFLLQCNKVVRDIAKFINKDWLTDIRDAVNLSVNSDTPRTLTPYLKELQAEVDAWLDVHQPNPEQIPNLAACQSKYQELLQASIERFRNMYAKV